MKDKTIFHWRIWECQNKECKERYLGTDQDYYCIYCRYREVKILVGGTVALGDFIK